MKKFFFFLALTVLTAGVLDSCTKDTSLSTSITGRRVDGTTYESIVTIRQQIDAINASIADLKTIRAGIRTLTEAKVAQGEDIAALKTADETLETRIAELQEYVENELKNYATTDWVEAGFATLEQHQKTQEALTETDARIGSLDEKLTQAIREASDNLTAQIEALSDRISALEEMIKSVTIIPAYSDGSVEAYGAVLTINCIVEPAAAVADLTEDNVTILVSTAKTKAKAISYETVSVAKLTKDATKGELTIKADISNVPPASNVQTLMAALRFASGITHYTTELYPVYSESNVDVADGGDAPMITIKADPDMPNVVAGTFPVAESFKESKPTTIEVQGIGKVTFDAKAAAKIKDNAEDAGATNILLKIEDVTTTKPVPNADVVYEVTMKTYDETGTEVFSEGKEDGVVTLEIPLDDDVVYVNSVTLVDADDNPVTGGVVPGSQKFENGILTFQVNHFSKYAVDYVKKSEFVAVTGVTLNKNTLPLIVSGTETLIATIAPADATNKSVTWSSSNPAVATVGTDGKVTAVSAGTATITVTTVDGAKTATCAVTVNNPVVNVTGVTLNKNTMTLIVGGTETLIATVTPDDATDKSVTWSSSNPAVATVGTDGKVTAVSAGTATITVTTVDGGKTATCAVTVTIPVTGVSLNKNTLTLTVGGSETLTATIAPTDATNKNVTWSSDNEAVATVDANGKVTAIAHGTATITVTTEDGSKTATCAVTVKTGTGFGDYGEGGNI